jgi:ABC-type glutathione transport system ATPase component
MLEINGLTVAYGERLALRNFSLSMQEGEIVALVGESGSGKTTAIRPVLGLLPPGGPKERSLLKASNCRDFHPGSGKRCGGRNSP